MGVYYLVSMIPLRMAKTGNEKLILWSNPVPSSTKYCRPLKIMFHRATADFVREQVDAIKNQIQTLIPIKIQIKGTEHHFDSVFLLTMIDQLLLR